MYDRNLNDRNISIHFNEEKNNPIEVNSEEFKEIKFHFNTIFNDISQGNQSSDQKIYEIEKAFSLKNQYISLNFEKREMNEVSSYGWFISDTSDDKKFDELIYKLKTKGLEKIESDINVSPPLPSNDSSGFHDIFLCKFIVGESLIIFQGDEMPELDDEFYEQYDTIVKVQNDKTKKYQILRLENINLLYLIKIKEGDFISKVIQCSNPNCKLNEPGNEIIAFNTKYMYYCQIIENYLCTNCHTEYHQNQIFNFFDMSKCEQKFYLNLPGECENIQNHNNNKTEIVDYFCQQCNKGICSFCRFYGNKKHQQLEIIQNLFGNSRPFEKENKSFAEISSVFTKLTNELTGKISETQKSNINMANILRTYVQKQFNKMYEEVNDKFTKEGEKLLRICYQLNFVKDILLTYHKLYVERENFLKNNKFRQEIFWTKRVHLEHMLYLIGIKEKIKTDYFVNDKEFDEIIDNYIENIDEVINDGMVLDENVVEENKPKNNLITIEDLIEEANIIDLNKNENN